MSYTDSLREAAMIRSSSHHRHHHRHGHVVEVIDVTYRTPHHHRRHSSLSSLEADEKSHEGSFSSGYQLTDDDDFDDELQLEQQRASFETAASPGIAILARTSPEIRALCKTAGSIESLQDPGLQMPMGLVGTASTSSPNVKHHHHHHPAAEGATSSSTLMSEDDETASTGEVSATLHQLWPTWTPTVDKNCYQGDLSELLLKRSSHDETNSTAESTTCCDFESLTPHSSSSSPHLSPTDAATPRVSLSPLERSLASLSFVSPSSFTDNNHDSSHQQPHSSYEAASQRHSYNGTRSRCLDPPSLQANKSSSTLPARLRASHRRVSYDMLPTPDQIALLTSPRSLTNRNFEKSTIEGDATPPRPLLVKRGASAPNQQVGSSGNRQQRQQERPRHRRNTTQIVVLPPQM